MLGILHSEKDLEKFVRVPDLEEFQNPGGKIEFLFESNIDRNIVLCIRLQHCGRNWNKWGQFPVFKR